MSLDAMNGLKQTSQSEDVFTDTKRKRRNSEDSRSSYGNEDTTSDSQGADDNKNAYDANQAIKDLQKKIDVLKRKRKNAIGKPEKNRLFAQINRYNKKIESIQAEMATQALHDEIAHLKQLNKQLGGANVPVTYQNIVSQMNNLRQEFEQTKADVQDLAKDLDKMRALEAENKKLKKAIKTSESSQAEALVLAEENKSLRQNLEVSKLEIELLKAEAQLQQVRTLRQNSEFDLLQAVQANPLHASLLDVQGQFQAQQEQDIQNEFGRNLSNIETGPGVNPQHLHHSFTSQPPILHQHDIVVPRASVLTSSPDGKSSFRVVYAKPRIIRTSKR